MTEAFAIPQDHGAERGLIGAAIHARAARELLLAEVPAAAFHHAGHRMIVTAIERLTHRGDAVDPVTIAAELVSIDGDGRMGLITKLGAEAVATSAARTLAGIVMDRWARRQSFANLQTATAAVLDPQQPLSRVVESATVAAETAAMPTLKAEPAVDVETFLAIEDKPEDWLIPGLLERGDRTVVTGTEGSGKSWFLRAFAAQVAAGRHPFTERPMQPAKVLVIDLENSERQVRRSLNDMWWSMKPQGYPCDPSNLRLLFRSRGLDLLNNAGHQRWLYAACEANKPDLLVTGPIYKLCGTSNKEDEAGRVAAVLDEVRARWGCSLLLEAHAPHATSPAGRDLRPYGASLWLRWPEFGFGLQWQESDPTRYRVAHWRGQRERRAWPTHVRQLRRPIPWGCIPSDLPTEDY